MRLLVVGLSRFRTLLDFEQQVLEEGKMGN